MARAQTNRQGKQTTLDRGERRAALHLLADLFIDARDADEDGGPDLAHGLGQLVELRAIGHLSPVGVHHVIQRTGGDVRKRQKRDAGVGPIEAEVRGGNILIRSNVAVRQHYAFGLARGSGGVNQRGQVIGLNRANQRVKDRVALSAAGIGPGQQLAEGHRAFGDHGGIHDEEFCVSEESGLATAFSLSNCWRVETTAIRQSASSNQGRQSALL